MARLLIPVVLVAAVVAFAAPSAPDGVSAAAVRTTAAARTSAMVALTLAPPDYSADCTSTGCHDGFGKLKVVHDPISADACDSCHQATEGAEHAFTLTEEGGALCFQCHDEFEGKVKHDPAAEGMCTTCHNPHASDHAKLLTEATAGPLCAECHDDLSEEHKYLHGPVASGSCTACHDAHAAPHGKLLRKTGTALCFECHTTLETALSGKRHVHAPAEEDCTSCHNAHGGDTSKFLNEAMPNLCVECHDEVGELMTDAKAKHSPVGTGSACANCHDAHATDEPGLLISTGTELCMGCHERAIAAGEATLPDLRAQLKELPNHHGPVDDGACGDCHAVHGSEHVHLLSGSYPAGFYAPFGEDEYALCLSCHDAEMVLEERTDSATGFRNGEQNLHYVHVHRERKGRTCRACHAVHASAEPRLLEESVPFGNWRIPIGFRGDGERGGRVRRAVIGFTGTTGRSRW